LKSNYAEIMAGFGFSPADVVELCKFSYRTYTEAKSAPERYASARCLADLMRKTLDVIPMNTEQVDPAMGVLALHLKRANNAYRDLDEYLHRFQEFLDPQTKPPVTSTKIFARVRWTTDQLDSKVDKLQDAVESAMRHCQYAMIAQTR
jgi:hypothetical protein